jgi:phosphoglycerate dehydrogenase-like enzyme
MMQVFPMEQLDAVLPTADFLVLACPLTRDTRGLIDARAIARLPTAASVVNIARGPIVDTAALCAALRQDRLAGALLDVFDIEPLPTESPIWDTPGLLVTPHISCDSPDYVSRSLQILGRNVRRLREGLTSQLENQVDAQLGY